MLKGARGARRRWDCSNARVSWEAAFAGKEPHGYMRNRRLIGIARPRGRRGGRGRRDDRWGEGIGRSAGGRGIIDARVGRELRGGGCHFSRRVSLVATVVWWSKQRFSNCDLSLPTQRKRGGIVAPSAACTASGGACDHRRVMFSARVRSPV